MVRRQLENAELDEAGLLKLVEQEVSDGFVLKFDGAMEDALLTWPSGVAKGKLSVARSLAKADRLVFGHYDQRRKILRKREAALVTDIPMVYFGSRTRVTFR